jgi:hypothetical protein
MSAGDTDRRARGTTARIGFVAAVIVSVASGTAGLQGRAESEAAQPPAAPLVEKAETVRAASGYTETRRFLERVEPARSTALAFERGERIVAV